MVGGLGGLVLGGMNLFVGLGGVGFGVMIVGLLVGFLLVFVFNFIGGFFLFFVGNVGMVIM